MPLNQDIVTQFKSTKDLDFANSPLGQFGYLDYVGRIHDVWRMIDEMIEIVSSDGELLNVYGSKVEDYARRFIDATAGTQRSQAQNPSLTLQQFSNQTKGVLDEFFSRIDGTRNDNSAEKDLRTVYSLLKSSIRRAPLQEYNDQLKELSKTLSQASIIKEGLGKASAAVAEDEFAKYFSLEASRYSGKFAAAERWLAAGIMSTAFLLVVVICWTPGGAPMKGMETSQHVPIVGQDSLQNEAAPEILRFGGHAETISHESTSSKISDPDVIEGLVRHILILSILIFIIKFAAKQYGVAKHLYALNSHKANLARTFRAILGSAVGQEKGAQDLVLGETVRSLSSYVSSGYIEQKDPEVTAVVDLAKAILEKAKS